MAYAPRPILDADPAATQRRGSVDDYRVATQRRYRSDRWKRVRAQCLAKHPLCAMCLAASRLMPAQVVDHIKPHRGNDRLFWDTSNLQSLCKPCHDGAKRFYEISGKTRGCDVNGTPLDLTHHWA